MSATQARRKRVTKSQEDRRDDLMRAGSEVFSDIGFQDATIEDITRVASVAKGTFYLYFDSKDHLLAALWERYVDAFVQTTDEVLGQGRDWRAAVDALLSALIEHAVRHADLHRIVYSSANAKALELCKRSNQRVIERIIAFVLDHVDPATAAIDPELACRMIYHAADGLLDDLIARRTGIDLAHVTRCVLTLARLTLADGGDREETT